MSIILSVIKTPQQLEIIFLQYSTFVFHHPSFILHHSSSSFIILHSSFIHPSFISRLLSFSACFYSKLKVGKVFERLRLSLHQPRETYIWYLDVMHCSLHLPPHCWQHSCIVQHCQASPTEAQESGCWWSHLCSSPLLSSSPENKLMKNIIFFMITLESLALLWQIRIFSIKCCAK